MPASDSASGPSPAIEIAVEAGDWPPPEELASTARRAIAAAMAAARPPISPATEISLVFTDDGHIRVLNRRYRANDAPTNVLSFPAAPPLRGEYGPLLGDIVLACETIGREAAEQGLTLTDHLTHLIVHGFLHLVGHDHETEHEAVRMERLESEILNRLGIADPYRA